MFCLHPILVFPACCKYWVLHFVPTSYLWHCYSANLSKTCVHIYIQSQFYNVPKFNQCIISLDKNGNHRKFKYLENKGKKIVKVRMKKFNTVQKHNTNPTCFLQVWVEYKQVWVKFISIFITHLINKYFFLSTYITPD